MWLDEPRHSLTEVSFAKWNLAQGEYGTGSKGSRYSRGKFDVRPPKRNLMKQKKYTCKKDGCTQAPYLGGLCRDHHKENEVRRRLHDDALAALHAGIVDGELPSDQRLREELDRLRDCWSGICTVVQKQRNTPTMPLDEADYAIDWCISLAQEIVKAQREILAGKDVAASLGFTQQWVWQRLQNLNAGLRSNGTRRE